MTYALDDTATSIASDVLAGRRSAVEVARQALALANELNPTINCFTATFQDPALAGAEAINAAVRFGRDPGPLAGVPIAVKNLFDVEGTVTLAGSVIEAENPPAQEDATLVARVRAAGATVVGALNMDEYAYGFTTENSHYGPVRNPHDTTRIAGGSSGGSAAAVAAGLMPVSLGSDTNGSIRVPAALCGVYGFKPTFGRLSRHGMKPFVHSLDHAGLFARTIEDLALAYDAIQGHDPKDPASTPRPNEPLSSELHRAKPAFRVGVLGGWFQQNATDEVMTALNRVAERLEAATAELPGAEAARAAAFCLTGAEGGTFHLHNLQRRAADFDPATRDRLIAGALQPAYVVARAQRVRRWFLVQALAAFEAFDILLAPTTPFPATMIGQANIEMGGQEVPIRANLGLYTQPISFIGLPVLSVPVVSVGALPVGVQLIAAPWSESALIRAAAWLESEGVIGARPPSSLRIAKSNHASVHDQ
jgi:AtzE family amidohydrolase